MDLSTLLLLADGTESADLLGWAVILGGMSVVGVIWIVWNINKLATNQVRIALMLEELIETLKTRKGK